MDSGNRLIGMMFATIGVVTLLVGIFFLSITYSAADAAGAEVGTTPILMVVGSTTFFLGVAAVIFWRDRVESRQYAEGENRRRILRLVEPTGRVNLGQVSLATGLTKDGLRGELATLVSEGYFRGYADWKDGWLVLIRREEMPEAVCPACGRNPSGLNGVPTDCEFCGAEIYR